MHFDDVKWPKDVRTGSETSPDFGIDVIYFPSRFRATNQRVAEGVSTFVVEAINSTQEFQEIIKINRVLVGPKHSGLIRDWSDWNSTDGNMDEDGLDYVTAFDQPLVNIATGLNEGDGSSVEFQAYKAFEVGAQQALQTIRKPDEDEEAWKVAVGGAEVLSGFAVDPASGKVTFDTPPGAGELTFWGGAYYKIFAFASNYFPVTLEAYHREGRSIELREVFVEALSE